MVARANDVHLELALAEVRTYSPRMLRGWVWCVAGVLMFGAPAAHGQARSAPQVKAEPKPAAPSDAAAKPAAKPATPARGAAQPKKTLPLAQADSTGSPPFAMPPYSVRFDPFNWLIHGRFQVELEVGVWRFITAELATTWIVNSTPPSFDFGSRDSLLSQHSEGLGPIAGGSLGLGFWLFGTPFYGYVARLSLSNVGVSYRASDASGQFDRVEKTERRLQLTVGSHTRIEWFTISGGLGFGYELNSQQRCFVNLGRPEMEAVSTGCQGDRHAILLDRLGRSTADLNGGLHPFYFLARFSVGVAFD